MALKAVRPRTGSPHSRSNRATNPPLGATTTSIASRPVTVHSSVSSPSFPSSLLAGRLSPLARSDASLRSASRTTCAVHSPVSSPRNEQSAVTIRWGARRDRPEEPLGVVVPHPPGDRRLGPGVAAHKARLGPRRGDGFGKRLGGRPGGVLVDPVGEVLEGRLVNDRHAVVGSSQFHVCSDRASGGKRSERRERLQVTYPRAPPTAASARTPRSNLLSRTDWLTVTPRGAPARRRYRRGRVPGRCRPRRRRSGP